RTKSDSACPRESLNAIPLPACGERDQGERHRNHCSFVASALVPAAQITPFAFEYIARSTTNCAGVAPRLSISAPYRRPSADGYSTCTLTLVRLFAGRLNVRTAVVPSSNRSVTRALPGN